MSSGLAHSWKVYFALTLSALLAISGCSASKSKTSRFASPVFSTRTTAAHRPTHYDPTPMRVSSYTPAPVRTQQPRPYSYTPSPTVSSWVTEPAWMPPGGISNRWTDIVVHHSASDTGGAAAFDRHHRMVNKWDELGYHFVIGNGSQTGNGAVEVGSRWTKQKHGAHCKTADNYYNDHGIGICLVGNFDRRQPTPQQLASLERLVRFLQQQCNIPAKRIRTHGGVTAKTACPGRNFSIAGLRNRLQMGGAYSQAGR